MTNIAMSCWCLYHVNMVVNMVDMDHGNTIVFLHTHTQHGNQSLNTVVNTVHMRVSCL